ncbi:MAG: DEAD/DEAH box helicase [Candidatus Hydrogenedens sp.]|nr:DEAD/DEAH box helicase [Candidatus Hydrogenedens sp.]
MRMRELLAYKVPEPVVDLWESQESGRLLPLQEMVVKRYDLFGTGNLLVQAPTSSGKTFIGEMAALHTALRRKKVVYLVPLKALAEEKYREFHRKYADYGVQVIISTRDHREHDRRLEDGDFSVAVVVYEKLAQLLVRRPERIGEIDLVIADELELLSDPERGAMTELLLTRILQGDCRLIGLSAVIGHADRLAKWMRAQLVYYERRPVELRYGVLFEGKFRYRTYNDFGEGEEELVEADEESSWEILTQNLCTFAERGESCLVFVKAKHESRRYAEQLAGRIDLPPATEAIEALRALEPTRSRDCLLHTLAHGVAFHNADLSPEEREAVEQAYRRGEVLAMVSTGTLAVGLNLPAQNVFLSAEKWRYDERLDIPWKTPILHHEYENMGGRAGRYGSVDGFGRSILIATSAFDFETLWRRYIDGEREPIEPRLARAPLENHVLRLVASRYCQSEPELLAFLESTLSGRWVWAELYPRDEIEARIRVAVNRCVDEGMIARDDERGLVATPLGQAVAAKGISIETARQLQLWIAQSGAREWAPIDLILAAASTPDGRTLQVMLTAREYEHAQYLKLLKQRTRDCEREADVPLNRLRKASAMPFFDEVRAIKTALFLDEWIGHAPMADIEEQYNTMSGQVLSAADQVSWLIDAAAAVASACGADAALARAMQRVSERLQFGVEDTLLPLARKAFEGMTRQGLLALHGEGLYTQQALRAYPLAALEAFVPATAAQALLAWADTQRDTPAVVAAQPAPARRPMLVIDERRPDEIVLDGETVALQEKQYTMLRILAENPG